MECSNVKCHWYELITYKNKLVEYSKLKQNAKKTSKEKNTLMQIKRQNSKTCKVSLGGNDNI